MLASDALSMFLCVFRYYNANMRTEVEIERSLREVMKLTVNQKFYLRNMRQLLVGCSVFRPTL